MPGFVPRWPITLLVVVIVIIVLALLVGALGGFVWHLQIGHFHWDVGVRKGA